MKRYASLFVLMFLAACATTGQEEKINAVKDFIEVNQLEKVNTRRDQYLLEYSYPCREDPLTQRPRPDIRRDSSAIYARSDTFRGCQIGALYPISKDQAEELKNIGEAPGEQ